MRSRPCSKTAWRRREIRPRRMPALSRPPPSLPRSSLRRCQLRPAPGRRRRLVVVVEERVRLLGSCRPARAAGRPTRAARPRRTCSRSAAAAPPPRLFHVPALRPWKRTYAIGAVAATTVRGTFFASERGASTVTYAMPRSSSQRSTLLDDALLEPRRVPELDQHPVVAELVGRPLEVVERRRLPDDVRRHLEEDPAELARRAQRLERVEERAEHRARAARAAAGRRGRGRRPACPRAGRAAPARAAPDAASSGRTPSRASRTRAACARPSPAPSSRRARGSRSSRPRPSRSAPRTRRAARAAGSPFGYQCSISASSAHEHVPMRTGVVTV